MIKNPRSYLNSQKKERQRFLSSLTYEESVRILEMLLLSQLARELSFSDHHPASLEKTFEMPESNLDKAYLRIIDFLEKGRYEGMEEITGVT